MHAGLFTHSCKQAQAHFLYNFTLNNSMITRTFFYFLTREEIGDVCTQAITFTPWCFYLLNPVERLIFLE